MEQQTSSFFKNPLFNMLLGLTVLIFVYMGFHRTTINLDWTPTFSGNSTAPLGSSFPMSLTQNDSQKKLIPATVPIAEYVRLSTFPEESATLFIHNTSFLPNVRETKFLLDFMYEGGTLFLAGRPGGVLESISGIRSVQISERLISRSTFTSNPDDALLKEIRFPGLQRSGNMLDDERPFLTLNYFLQFGLVHRPASGPAESDSASDLDSDTGPTSDDYSSENTAEDTATTPDFSLYDELINSWPERFGEPEWLAFSDDNPVMVRMPLGSGQLIVVSSPYLLSNYHFWRKDLEPAAAAVWSYVPDGSIIWDSHYKAVSLKPGNFLYVLMDSPALKSAWFYVLFLTMLFVLFMTKRKQRIQQPPSERKNAQGIHLNRVAGLYMKYDKTGEVLALRCRYLSHRINVNYPCNDKELLSERAEKYEIPQEKLIRLLYDYPLSSAENNRSISKAQLKELNEDLEHLLGLLDGYSQEKS
ncbi:MAG: hypothetical protein LAT67_02735 [Balneolales bacterium]|nr:hypothetical protein [Balneolales bacterium]